MKSYNNSNHQLYELAIIEFQVGSRLRARGSSYPDSPLPVLLVLIIIITVSPYSSILAYATPESAVSSSEDNGNDDNGPDQDAALPQDDDDVNVDGGDEEPPSAGGDPLKGLNVDTKKGCPPVSKGTVIENPFEEKKPCPTTTTGIDIRNTTVRDELMINQTG